MARIGPRPQPHVALKRVALAASIVIASLVVSLQPTVAQSGITCAPKSPASTPAATPVTTDPTPTAFPDNGGELTIFAAASLTDAFTEVAADLEKDVSNLEIAFNFGGSQALATQLTEGAAADLFAPADPVQMETAIRAGRIAAGPVPFVQNRLTVVVPTDNPANIQSPADLANDDLKLVLAQTEVPAGRYTRQSICAMTADPASYGDDFAANVAANIVSEEEDVRAVLTRIQFGEADAGIVYISDAYSAAAAVTTIEIPASVNVLATYPIAPVESGDEILAAAFISYLLGPDGQATLRQYGFEPILNDR